MGEHLKRGDPTAAVIQAVNRAGELLGRHFARQRTDRNELPDDVSRD